MLDMIENDIVLLDEEDLAFEALGRLLEEVEEGRPDKW